MSIAYDYGDDTQAQNILSTLCIINVNDNVDVCRLKMEEEKKELEERLSSPAALYTNEGTYLPCVIHVHECRVYYMYDLYITSNACNIRLL